MNETLKFKEMISNIFVKSDLLKNSQSNYLAETAILSISSFLLIALDS